LSRDGGGGLLGGNEVRPQFESDSHLSLSPPAGRIWEGNVGEAFGAGRTSRVQFGRRFGMAIIGSNRRMTWPGHVALWLGLQRRGGPGPLVSGQLGVAGEAFGGGQFHPHKAYVAGALPLSAMTSPPGRGGFLF